MSALLVEVAPPLALTLLAGIGAVRACGLRWRSDPIAYLGWAWIAGCLVTAAFVLAWVAAPFPLRAGPALVGAFAALAAALFAAGSRSAAPPPAPARASGLEQRVFAAALAFALVLTAVRVLTGDVEPVVRGDEAEFWALKAKVIYVSAGFDAGFEEAMNGAYVRHKDYPLLHPLLQVWMFAHAGEITHVVNRLPVQGCAFALVLVLAAALRRRVRPGAAALLLLCTLAVPSTFHQARTAFVDGPVALGVLVALDAGMRWREERRAPWWRLLCVGLAFMLWAKNEGLMYLVALAGALVVASLRTRFARSVERAPLAPASRARWLWLALPAAVVALTWGFNTHFGFENDIVSGALATTPASDAPPPSAKLTKTLAFVTTDVLLYPRHANLFFLAFLVLVAVFPLRLARSPLQIPTVALALVLCGYVAVFVVTPHALDWHLPSAAPRVMSQSLPALTLWLGMAAAELFPTWFGVLPAGRPKTLEQSTPEPP